MGKTGKKGITKKTWAWIGTVIFGLLIFAGGFSSIFWILSILNVIPINKWQTFKKEKLKLGKGLSIVLGIVLFFIGGALMQDTDTSDKQIDNNSSIVETVKTTELIDESTITTTEITTTINSTTEEPNTTTTAVTTISTTNIIAETTTASTTKTTIITEEIPENSTFSIHFIDVGQADATLIECDGHYMLIDGGNKADSNRIYSLLKKAEVPKLDIIVGTHAHEDHIGGLPGALNYTTADLVLSPVTQGDTDAFNDFKKYAEQQSSGLTVPSVGDTYDLGSADVKILGVNGGTETNDTSIILMIEYGETRFLFTGDAERDAEQAAQNSGVDLSATLIKVGHHGSDTSTSYVWLNEIMPEYAIISVGKENSYDHPTDAVLSRLRDADVKTYRTDLNGDIYVTSDGKTLNITTQKNATEDEIFTAGSSVRETTPPATEAPVTTTTKNDDIASVGRDYVVNTNTGKFHETWCSSADSIKPKNRWDYYGTRDELISSGYVPCKKCNP